MIPQETVSFVVLQKQKSLLPYGPVIKRLLSALFISS